VPHLFGLLPRIGKNDIIRKNSRRMLFLQGKPMSQEINTRIQQVLASYAELSKDAFSLGEDDDLFTSGMSSRATVGVMLGLESEFDIEFPDNMLRRDVFESIRSISNAVNTLIA
jgi:acyl carrier protein